MYLLETSLSKNKSVLVALMNIYGINKNNATLICNKLGFSINLKVKDLTQEQKIEILNLIESLNLIFNDQLREFNSSILIKLVSIKSYRGLRRIRGLPVRGQRTHTNAKSARKNKRL